MAGSLRLSRSASKSPLARPALSDSFAAASSIRAICSPERAAALRVASLLIRSAWAIIALGLGVGLLSRLRRLGPQPLAILLCFGAQLVGLLLRLGQPPFGVAGHLLRLFAQLPSRALGGFHDAADLVGGGRGQGWRNGPALVLQGLEVLCHAAEPNLLVLGRLVAEVGLVVQMHPHLVEQLEHAVGIDLDGVAERTRARLVYEVVELVDQLKDLPHAASSVEVHDSGFGRRTRAPALIWRSRGWSSAAWRAQPGSAGGPAPSGRYSENGGVAATRRRSSTPASSSSRRRSESVLGGIPPTACRNSLNLAAPSIDA